MNAYLTLYYFCMGTKWDNAYIFEDFEHISQQICVDTMLMSNAEFIETADFSDIDF